MCPGGREGSWEERAGAKWGRAAHAHAPRPGVPQHLQLVRQEMAVCPEQLSDFLDSLRQYVRGTAGARNCFQ